MTAGYIHEIMNSCLEDGFVCIGGGAPLLNKLLLELIVLRISTVSTLFLSKQLGVLSPINFDLHFSSAPHPQPSMTSASWDHIFYLWQRQMQNRTYCKQSNLLFIAISSSSPTIALTNSLTFLLFCTYSNNTICYFGHSLQAADHSDLVFMTSFLKDLDYTPCFCHPIYLFSHSHLQGSNISNYVIFSISLENLFLSILNE